MSNKNIITLFILFIFISSIYGEIIQRSKLINNKKPFILKRDLFSPKRTRREINNRRLIERNEQFKVREEKIKKKHEDLFDNIIYEGFVLKQNQNTVLLSINGEFVTCKEGETILDKIEILKVSLKSLTIKIENKKYDIKLKGDEDEEQ